MRPWDLHAVKPSFFPVPAAAVLGTKTAAAKALPGSGPAWAGKLPGRNLTLTDAASHLTQAAGVAVQRSVPASPWATRFAQGATLVPRFLTLVEPAPAGPLGAGAGRRAVRSQRSNSEKRPWKDLPGLTGTIERDFVRPVYLGDSVLPFRTLTPRLGVIPWDGTRLLSTANSAIDNYPGLEAWTRTAEAVWLANRTQDSKLTLFQQLDYRHKLRGQFPIPPHRVVYSASGMYLAAAYLSDATTVTEHQLYWATVSGPAEARFLTAVLNSDALLQVVRPLQARGEHNPRHFDKYVFQAPIPLYDPTDDRHRDLVDLAERAEHVAAGVELTPGSSFQAGRRRIRQALIADGVAAALDEAVTALLPPPAPSMD